MENVTAAGSVHPQQAYPSGPISHRNKVTVTDNIAGPDNTHAWLKFIRRRPPPKPEYQYGKDATFLAANRSSLKYPQISCSCQRLTAPTHIPIGRGWKPSSKYTATSNQRYFRASGPLSSENRGEGWGIRLGGVKTRPLGKPRCGDHVRGARMEG